MKFTYMDICDSSTLPFKLLQTLTDRENYLRKQADRVRELDRYLVCYIQEGRITDTNDIDTAITLLNNSMLTASEIIKKVAERVDKSSRA